MSLLQKDDRIALVALSNALDIKRKNEIEALCDSLREMGLHPICSVYLYQGESVRGGSAKEKAAELEAYYQNQEIKAIFDVSGGDIANEVLCEVDFERIRLHPKMFWGYSDLTTILNSIYTKTKEVGCLYQIRNLVGADSVQQQANFSDVILNEGRALFNFRYHFIQGKQMKGTVIGGNIRCFLKLAGTSFMPDFEDKILFLESRSGGAFQMITFLSQYKQLGAFEKVNGILLGSFTQMEREDLKPSIEELIVEIVGNPSMPIAKTSEIGHGQDSKAILIGSDLELCE